MITDVAGVQVGHWTDHVGKTGCTVVLFPPDTVASGEVRGGAPATREFDLLAPERWVQRIDAVMLSGGSAFGLAACDGAMRWCEEQHRGFPTRAGPVPIVVGASLFDLSVGDSSSRPGPEAGYAACQRARPGPFEVGHVGAGTGANSGKWRQPGELGPGGLVSATRRHEDLVVSALVAVNASGDVLSRRGRGERELPQALTTFGPHPLESTTIGVVVTNAPLDKMGCFLVAQSAQDGLARAVEPVHGATDGDAMVAAAVGGIAPVPSELVRLLAGRATADAVGSLSESD